MRMYWPGLWVRQPRPGLMTTVAALAVSGRTATMRPRRSAPERSGSIRSRKSSGSSGVASASATFRAPERACLSTRLTTELCA